ncbi:molybdate ABC transporter substrate-binding protein [Pleionea litopenaei]|uniref:Molybdate ABC transporter substrate-binding protein n=1 Tax=Pleionea litopenaei TaxID=3070815 RepID=A0AA51RSM9_9GAMM|nr:molybdate ABC transporter substrate-binding protein [Pleionea sp. HL-JVS1]WMS86759.1 molybdate ABC transporter substrate-binding protein [Pleionea sp. HL-JVS1]
MQNNHRFKKIKYVIFCALLWSFQAFAKPTLKAKLRVAVATNFYSTLNELVQMDKQDFNFEVELIPGASGRLMAQIERNAPFDVFLSADAEKPFYLVSKDKLIEQSVIEYTRGSLMLVLTEKTALSFSEPDVVNEGNNSGLNSDDDSYGDSYGDSDGHSYNLDYSADLTALTEYLGACRRITIAQPTLAPYGKAALEVLKRADIQHEKERLIFAENVAQSLHFIIYGKVDCGIVARSFAPIRQIGRYIKIAIPSSLHSPIEQFGGIVADSKNIPLAKIFLDYLQKPETQEKLMARGYLSVGVFDDQ